MRVCALSPMFMPLCRILFNNNLSGNKGIPYFSSTVHTQDLVMDTLGTETKTDKKVIVIIFVSLIMSVVAIAIALSGPGEPIQQQLPPSSAMPTNATNGTEIMVSCIILAVTVKL